MTNSNDEALAARQAEMAELGLKPHAQESKPNKQEAEQDEKPVKTEDQEKPKKSDTERTDRTSKKDTEDSSEKDEKKENRDRPKKYKPIDEYTSEKKAWKDREQELLSEIDTIKKGKGTKEDKIDDIDERVKKFAEKAGVDDPAILRELLELAGETSSSKVKELEQKLNDLLEDKKTETESKKSETATQKAKEEAEYFDKEWDSFLPQLEKSFGELSGDQMKEAKVVMDEIAHSPKWGKYDLDYIFFKNQSDFEDAIGVKKEKGPGQGRTQTTLKDQAKGANASERPVLSSDPTFEEIQAYEKWMGSVQGKGRLSERPMDSI